MLPVPTAVLGLPAQEADEGGSVKLFDRRDVGCALDLAAIVVAVTVMKIGQWLSRVYQ